MTRKSSIMVCISTQQNTTNLVPFLQHNFNSMVLLETDFAKEKNWSRGLQEAISQRNKEVKMHSVGQGTDLTHLISLIREIVGDYERVCWNIGGGQKMQQLALLRVFQERLAAKKTDWACYSDPGTKKIFTIEGNHLNLTSSEELIRADVTLDDILTVFGLQKRESNNPLLLWQRKEPDLLPASTNFRDLSLFWDKQARRSLLHWAITEEGEQPEVLQGLKHGYADYFEQVVQFEVAKLLKQHGPHHHITQAWANVRVKTATGEEIAEWDITLVTDFGTLVILDAKTGLFSPKDEDARLLNLERATGVYRDFWLIIPYMFEDIEDDIFYQRLGPKGKDLRKIPFELSRLKSKCLAVTGHGEPFTIKKMKKNKVKIITDQENTETEQNTLRIKDICSLLKELRLQHTV